jgi:hypothetical protein
VGCDERVLEVRRVAAAVGDDRDRRIAALGERAAHRALDPLEQRLGAVVVRGRVERQHRAQRPRCRNRVGEARRRARVVLEHLQFAATRAHEVQARDPDRRGAAGPAAVQRRLVALR